jgi:hypothetical protein
MTFHSSRDVGYATHITLTDFVFWEDNTLVLVNFPALLAIVLRCLCHDQSIVGQRNYSHFIGQRYFIGHSYFIGHYCKKYLFTKNAETVCMFRLLPMQRMPNIRFRFGQWNSSVSGLMDFPNVFMTKILVYIFSRAASVDDGKSKSEFFYELIS